MDIDGLGRRQRQVVEAIVGAPLAWSARRAISRRAHVRSGPILERLAALAWVARWTRARDGRALKADYWTLTPLGAAWAGVRLDEEREGEPRWFAGPVVTPLRSHEVHLRWPERVPDPRPPVEYLADLDAHEVTTDLAEACRLFGIPVRIDHRRKPATAPARGR